MNLETSAYGLWSLVLLNSFVFIMFAFSFTGPQTVRDWRSLGAFSAFIVALFAEMYGFPLTIYLLLPLLSAHFPGVDFFGLDAGHLLQLVFGRTADPHVGLFHILSHLFIFGGFIMLSYAWIVLHESQRHRRLATTGIYARIRHPQYVAFVFIMFGFLLQWPTLITLVLFPLLVWAYVRLARSEERDMAVEFGSEYEQYRQRTPAFIPTFTKKKIAP